MLLEGNSLWCALRSAWAGWLYNHTPQPGHPRPQTSVHAIPLLGPDFPLFLRLVLTNLGPAHVVGNSLSLV